MLQNEIEKICKRNKCGKALLVMFYLVRVQIMV